MTVPPTAGDAASPQLLELLDNLDAFQREAEHSPLARALVLQTAAQTLRTLAASRREPAAWARAEGMLRELGTLASDVQEAASASALEMEPSWTVAATLVRHAAVADQLGERHRMIANDWQAADLQLLAVRLVRRAVDLVGHAAAAPPYLRSASELLDRGADLLAEAAALMHDNEHRRHGFDARVTALIA